MLGWSMRRPKPPNEAPKLLIDGAIASEPRIVNGLTVRPPKKVNVWLFGLPLLPDFVALPILSGFGLHRLIRYLNTLQK